MASQVAGTPRACHPHDRAAGIGAACAGRYGTNRPSLESRWSELLRVACSACQGLDLTGDRPADGQDPDDGGRRAGVIGTVAPVEGQAPTTRTSS